MNYFPQRPFDNQWVFAQQGWQCPACKNVWAPWVMMCQVCETKKPESAIEQ